MAAFTKLHLTFTTLLLAVCVVLCLLLNNTCNKVKDGEQFQSMYNASMDTLSKTRNELGQEVTTRKLLYGDVQNLKKLNAGKDSTLTKLQALVTKHTITASILNNTTSNNIYSHTNSVTGRDTLWSHDTLFIYPQYATKFKNKWEDFEVSANRDTFMIDYKVFNEFAIQQKFEKQKVKGYVFKQSVPVVQVTNANPHTITTDMQSFSVQPPKNNAMKKILVGVGLGLIGGYAIFH